MTLIQFNEYVPPRRGPNILGFAKTLGLELSPVQKFILKIHYGIPLDPNVNFSFTEIQRKIIRCFNEPSYLSFLQSEGRAFVSTSSSTVVISGRRSGKTKLSRLVALFDALNSVWEYGKYGLGVLHVSLSKDDAFSAERNIRDLVHRFLQLVPYTHPVPYNKRGVSLGIRISFASPHASLRGVDASSVVLDELFSYPNPMEIVNSVCPSGRYENPSRRLLTLTSPSKDFDLHRRRTLYQTETLLRIPTWEANPSAILYPDDPGFDFQFGVQERDTPFWY